MSDTDDIPFFPKCLGADRPGRGGVVQDEAFIRKAEALLWACVVGACVSVAAHIVLPPAQSYARAVAPPRPTLLYSGHLPLCWPDPRECPWR